MFKYPKYYKKVWIDIRDNLKWTVYSYNLVNHSQTKYWIEIKRPKGKKILKKICEFESTITKLMPYLKEITS